MCSPLRKGKNGSEGSSETGRAAKGSSKANGTVPPQAQRTQPQEVRLPPSRSQSAEPLPLRTKEGEAVAEG